MQYNNSTASKVMYQNKEYLNVLNTKNLQDIMMQHTHPVGSYYETSDANFNPNITWGGTWVLETPGMLHISGATSGTYYVNGANGNNGAGIKDLGNDTEPYTPSATIGLTVSTTYLNDSKYLPKLSGTASLRPNANASNTRMEILYSASGAFSISRGDNAAGIKYSTANGGANYDLDLSFGGNGGHGHTGSTATFKGTATSFDIRQDSICIYRWHRIA